MELVPSQRGRLSLAFREIANSVPNSGMTTTVVDEHDSLSVGRAGATIAHVVALCSVFPTPRSHRGVGFSGRGHVAAFLRRRGLRFDLLGFYVPLERGAGDYDRRTRRVSELAGLELAALDGSRSTLAPTLLSFAASGSRKASAAFRSLGFRLRTDVAPHAATTSGLELHLLVSPVND